MTFILVWVLVTFDSYSSGMVYSPPMQTLEDCQRIQKFRKDERLPSQCIQISVLRGSYR